MREIVIHSAVFAIINQSKFPISYSRQIGGVPDSRVGCPYRTKAPADCGRGGARRRGLRPLQHIISLAFALFPKEGGFAEPGVLICILFHVNES